MPDTDKPTGTVSFKVDTKPIVPEEIIKAERDLNSIKEDVNKVVNNEVLRQDKEKIMIEVLDKIKNEKMKEPSTSTSTNSEPSIFASTSEKIKDFEKSIENKTGNSKLPLAVFLGIALLAGGYMYFPKIKTAISSTYEHVLATRLPGTAETQPEIKSETPASIPDTTPTPPVHRKRDVSHAEILDVRDYYLRLMRNDESIEVRTGGSLSWRANNPCLVLYGKFSKNSGSIGKVEKYSVFETYDLGRKACYDLLFTSDHEYKNKTVADAVRRFAPVKEGFKTDKYLKAVAKAKINTGTKMEDLSESNRQKLIDVLMDVEDFNPGKVLKYKDIQDFEERGY